MKHLLIASFFPWKDKINAKSQAKDSLEAVVDLTLTNIMPFKQINKFGGEVWQS